MRTSLIFLVIMLITLTACNLAGDVTPPPGLPTQQAVLPEPSDQPSTSIPADEPLSIAVISPPEQKPDLMNGGLIYAEKCAPCHGYTGMGDGSLSGNLEIAPTKIGDTDIGRSAVPAEWHEIVTEGRLNRFMPPFSSLSNSERWDVVTYALTLSTTQSELGRGEERYVELCADCHGNEGEIVLGNTALSDPSFISTRSLEDMTEVIVNGGDTMPAFQDLIDEEDLWAIGAYIRFFASESKLNELVEESEPQGEILGRVIGTVINGTQGMAPPENLEVTLLAFDEDQPVLTVTTSTDSAGEFDFSDLEIIPGRIFGAFIEHEGVPYYSTAAHFFEDASIIELPIVVYESTAIRNDLEVERVHLVFEYPVEGIAEVSEVWLISNTGDRTIIGGEGSGTLEIPLPDGHQDPRLTDSSNFAELSISDGRVILQNPILPGETLDLVFTFTLPYERSRSFHQPMTVPVGDIVALSAEDAPEIRGENVVDQGLRDMGGAQFRTYAIEPPAMGEALAFDLSGRHPASASLMDSSNLMISIGILGLALILVGIGWRYAGSRSQGVDEEQVPRLDANRDKQSLLHAIAALDDAFEAGEISKKEYEDRRAALKRDLAELMKGEYD